ncbi:MAG: O-methyltransferase [Acidimicrobiales bacterium]
MSRSNVLATTELGDYVTDHATPPDPVAARLIERTSSLGSESGMQLGHPQAVLLTMLTQLTGATNAIEIGTFTGYSSLAIARGLGPGGRLLCCDISQEWTAIAKDTWSEACVDDRIDLVIGPALDTVRALDNETVFDLAFIDADKEGQIEYHEELVPKLRPGGLLIVDNVLWGGRVVDAGETGQSTVAIRAYNQHALNDPRVDNVIVPIGDGLHVSRKR